MPDKTHTYHVLPTGPSSFPPSNSSCTTGLASASSELGPSSVIPSSLDQVQQMRVKGKAVHASYRKQSRPGTILTVAKASENTASKQTTRHVHSNDMMGVWWAWHGRSRKEKKPIAHVFSLYYKAFEAARLRPPCFSPIHRLRCLPHVTLLADCCLNAIIVPT